MAIHTPISFVFIFSWTSFRRLNFNQNEWVKCCLENLRFGMKEGRMIQSRFWFSGISEIIGTFYTLIVGSSNLMKSRWLTLREICNSNDRIRVSFLSSLSIAICALISIQSCQSLSGWSTILEFFARIFLRKIDCFGEKNKSLRLDNGLEI